MIKDADGRDIGVRKRAVLWTAMPGHDVGKFVRVVQALPVRACPRLRGGRLHRGACKQLRSFPRKRESRINAQILGPWVPAFAGTNGVLKFNASPSSCPAMTSLGHSRVREREVTSACWHRSALRGYRLLRKSPCRPRPSLKRLAPATPSSISASRPLYHSWMSASRTVSL